VILLKLFLFVQNVVEKITGRKHRFVFIKSTEAVYVNVFIMKNCLTLQRCDKIISFKMDLKVFVYIL